MAEKALRSVRGDWIAMILQEPMTSFNPYIPVGEQVAEAVMCHRKVTRKAVMDETSALGRSVQQTVLELLKDIQQWHNIAYLFISHDLSVIRAISDEVIVMQKGEVVERGTADQIFEAPQQAYTRRLIDACMLVDEVA